MPISKKHLLLFDLDGTLIDSVPSLAFSVNLTLKELNYKTFSEDTIREWVGNGAQVLIKRALSGSIDIDKNLDTTLANKALDIFLNFYQENLTKDLKLYPDIKETLKYLKDKKYTLAIITNKPYRFISPILKHFQLDNLFDSFIGGDSLKSKKPSGYPLEYMIDKFNTLPKHSIMIGDSKNDIIAANNTNIDSIAVTYGYNYFEDISIYNPTIIVDNFKDIKKYL